MDTAMKKGLGYNRVYKDRTKPRIHYNEQDQNRYNHAKTTRTRIQPCIHYYDITLYTGLG